MRPLTDRDIETLIELEASIRASRRYNNGFSKPLDIGGTNGSHHSQTLRKLADRGLAVRRKHGGPRERGSCLYGITEAGKEVVGLVTIARRYNRMTGEPMILPPTIAAKIRAAGIWRDDLFVENKPLPLS